MNGRPPSHGGPPGYPYTYGPGPGLYGTPYAPPPPPPPALYTVNYRCKTCHKLLATCSGVAHAQLEQAMRNGATQAFCVEPGHIVNINVEHEIVPFQPPAQPVAAPPPVVSQAAQAPSQGGVLGSVMGTKEPPVDPAADAILKAAAAEQASMIAQRGGNTNIDAARNEAPAHPNGAAS